MSSFATLTAVLFLYMCVWFAVSLIKKRNDVADVAWGLGFVLLAWVSFALAEVPSVRSMFATAIVSIWGIRLALHIAARHRGKGEDYRYATWRSSWGRWFYIRSFFQVYILQGFLLFLVAVPVLLINDSLGKPWGTLDYIGVLIWLVGFLFESVGDSQLAHFIKNPENRGRLMQGGLWHYTRHPNYFGEVAQWWGIWLLALSTPYGWFGIIGPLTITFLILKVSGVPLLEQKMSEHPEFGEYKRRTSMFIPLPPKR